MKGDNSSKKRIRVKGLVTAADWDEDGNIIDIMLTTDDDTNYYIVNCPKKKKLFKLLQETVQVSGTIGYLEDDELAMRVDQIHQTDDVEMEMIHAQH